MPTSTVHRICPFCEATCGLDIQMDGPRVVSVRGQASDVFSAGYICPKGVALKDLHDDPDRVRTPLIKRNGRFEVATWEDAFDEIERRLVPILEKHGRHAVALSSGNPSAHKMGLALNYGRLAKAIGTRNFFTASTLDQMPKHLSSGMMFGHWLSVAVPDMDRTDLLLVLGANPVASNGSMWTVPDFRGRARALQARGGKLIVVDPRRTETAEIADQHLSIRPGGDVFLLLGIVHTLHAERLVRTGRIGDHLNGLAELEAAVAGFDADTVSARCGIEAETIRTLARDLAAAPRAVVYGRMGLSVQAYGTLCNWLIDVINILTGHLDEPGGAMFPKAAAFQFNSVGTPGRGRGVVTGRHRSRVSGAPEVFGELPSGCLAEEIETPGQDQVRALITVASNPVLSNPNGPRLSAAFEQLEFMVSLDIYLNETSRHADVILPGLSPLEDSHCDVAFPQFAYRNAIRYSPAVLPKPPGARAEWESLVTLMAIVQGRGARTDPAAYDNEMLAADARRQFGEDGAKAVLAQLTAPPGPERHLELSLRSGPYGDHFGQRPDGLTLERVKAAPSGIDLGPLAPRVPEMLRTASGRIELAPPLFLDDLQRVRDDLTRPLPDLVIIGRRHVRSNNSWMHNLPTLAKGPFRCTVMVHPDDAQRLGLRDGAFARIDNGASASIEAQVEVSDQVMRGVASLPHGWGHTLPDTRLGVAAERPGVNLNAILDDALRDPLSGNSVLAGVPVRMSPAH